MDWSERCCVARVRLLALRAMVSAGGEPAGWQVRRVVAPVIADLLPLAAGPDRLADGGSVPVSPWIAAKGVRAGRRARSKARGGRRSAATVRTNRE